MHCGILINTPYWKATILPIVYHNVYTRGNRYQIYDERGEMENWILSISNQAMSIFGLWCGQRPM